MQFKWNGITQSGEIVTGITEAENLAAAKAGLRKQGIIARNIAKKYHVSFSRYHQSIKQTDISLFSRQLATLFKTGIPILRSLEILEKGSRCQRMKTLIKSIKQDLGSGLMLAQSLRKHPALFNTLLCNMVDAGERSGTLDVMLDKVANHREKMADITQKIRKALAYPTTVILIAILVIAGLLTFVIPQFESLFTSFGAELPSLTRFVIDLSRFFKNGWQAFLCLFSGLAYGSIYLHRHYLAFAKINHQLILRLPIIGNIVQNASIARISRTLSMTIAAGLPLIDALTLVAGITGNHRFTQAVLHIKNDINNGQCLHQAMQNTLLFPNMIIQLIEVGEETGTLENMLEKAADIYENDVGIAVDTLSSLLEPAIMTILGLLIGGLVVAMYLPIIKLGAVV